MSNTDCRSERKLAVLSGVAACLCLMGCIGITQAADSLPVFRCGWGVGDEVTMDRAIDTAKELHFTALVWSGKLEAIRTFSEKTKAAGLESYCWLPPIAPRQARDSFMQVMMPEETARADKIRNDPRAHAHGFQGGGEPIPGRLEVLPDPIPCFHRPEVVVATKARIKETLDASPELTGLALDMFGYQNYRCCHCEHSQRQLAHFRQSHPQLSAETAQDRFSLETLVAFQNEMCAYARSLRPGIQLTVHVWPTFLPEPVYGNRLDVDYCQQTVAWFFKPYWNDQKIQDYTRKVVDEAAAYHKNQIGVPFIGIFTGRKEGMNKSAERMQHELRVIYGSTTSRNFGTYKFNDLVDHPKHKGAMKEVLDELAANPEAVATPEQAFAKTSGQSENGSVEDIEIPATIPQFICYQVPNNRIEIDGKLDEGVWKEKPVIRMADLKYGTPPFYDGAVKIVWDSEYLYVGYDLIQPDVWASVKEVGTGYEEECRIMHEDLFVKFFLDPDGDGLNYLEWQVNPANAVAELALDMPYSKFSRKEMGLSMEKQNLLNLATADSDYWHWDSPGLKTAVHVHGTLDDSTDVDHGWGVEIAIPWESIKKFTKGHCPPAETRTWRCHLGRVHRSSVGADCFYWTWPVLDKYDCHLPARWGVLVFKVSGR